MLAAISSITYPAISAFISNHASADSQGIAQGMVTGIRGLCNGIGPALYGLIFWIFHVDLNESSASNISTNMSNHQTTSDEVWNFFNFNITIFENNAGKKTFIFKRLIPGPPFLFGSILALAGLIITLLLPSKTFTSANKSETVHKHLSGSMSFENEDLIETNDSFSSTENSTALSPLLIPLMIQDSLDFNSSNKLNTANVTADKQQ